MKYLKTIKEFGDHVFNKNESLDVVTPIGIEDESPFVDKLDPSADKEEDIDIKEEQ